RYRKNVFFFYRATVFVAKQILQKHLHRERKPRNPLQAVLLSRGQAVINVGLAADLEGLLAFEAVERGHVRNSRFLAVSMPEARRGQITNFERRALVAAPRDRRTIPAHVAYLSTSRHIARGLV